jgi:hypothetical protein
MVQSINDHLARLNAGAGPINQKLRRDQALTFGPDARVSNVTGMPYERGSGCLSEREQELKVHLPEILRTQGRAAWEAAYRKLTGGSPK